MSNFVAALLLLPVLQQEEARIRVEVTLVQVDAVVTGRDGKQVRDLGKDDFAVLEDGKPRELLYATYVRSDSGGGRAAAGGPNAARAVDRADVGRTIALLVDDLRMSFEGIHHAREALHAFVDRQMQPGDLVAVLSTSGKVTALQPFTTDKKQLHAAINRLRYLLWAGGARGVTAALGAPGEDDAVLGAVRQRRFNVGMLGTIRYVTRGMRGLPGRKSVVLFSEGIQVPVNSKGDSTVTTGELFRVADEANKSAVVVYGLDVRGLVYPGLQAVDRVDGDADVVRDMIADRERNVRDSQSGLVLLARQTGGTAFINDNDLNSGLARMLEEQSGYYLLGFRRPEDAVGKPNRLVVRLAGRPNLRLQYRRGAVGEAPGAPAERPQNPRERLFAALASPFASGGFAFRLSSSYAVDDSRKLALQAQLYFDASELSLGEPDASGLRAAKVHVMATAEGEDGLAAAPVVEAYTVRMKNGQGGFAYDLRQAVKKPGAYQLRVAVLDEASGRVGSATRLVEIPDVAKGAVGVSAINMMTGDWRAGGGGALARVFERGQPFSYGLTVFNARPGMALEPRLRRGDQVVWEGKRIAVGGGARAPGGGVLTLGARTTPGEYELEVRVVGSDGQALGAAQSVEFELR